ncbi:MAG TPA: TlpA disulfide reductase family protein [Clostridia bacterium]|nr:TlpA disulfide reductase family protein [Clostridia bacterium]
MMKRVISVLLLSVVLFIGCSATEEPVNNEMDENNDTEVIETDETVEESKSIEDSEEDTTEVEKEDDIEILDPNAFVPFEGVDFDGNAVTNDIFKENKLTLVNVWGTNCGPCLEEIPYLEEIEEELSDDGFKIIGFLAGGEAYKEEAVELMGLLEADYMNVIVPEDVFRTLGVQYIPTSFLVDSEGNVVEKRIVGALTKERYLEKINQHLK